MVGINEKSIQLLAVIGLPVKTRPSKAKTVLLD